MGPGPFSGGAGSLTRGSRHGGSVREDGTKELVAVEDGFRESTESWYELLSDLRRRGLSTGPKLAIGDGAMGFWNSMAKVFPESRHQRCWVHKTANPIESTFATVRLRTNKMRSSGSWETTLAMVFKLVQSAEKRWKLIKFSLIGEVITGVVFRDGLRTSDQSDRAAA